MAIYKKRIYFLCRAIFIALQLLSGVYLRREINAITKRINPMRNLIDKIEENANIDKSFKKEVYRKAIHLSSLWIPALIYFTQPAFSIFLFSLLFCGDALLEYGNYKKYPWARQTFGKLFFKTLRDKECRRKFFQVSGSLYVLLAAIVCTLFFSKPIAIISLTVMLVSDTMAALVGKAFGTRMLYKHKSLEGTVAFFMSALLINMLFEPLFQFTYAGVIACMAATLAELYEDKIDLDDNLSIPLFVGIILTLLG